MSVEDIERNIRTQQHAVPSKPENGIGAQTPQQLQMMMQLQQQMQFARPSAPPGIPQPKGPLFSPQAPIASTGVPKPAPRLPPGFAPLPQNIMPPAPPHMNNMNRPPPMGHNLPTALNNFAVKHLINYYHFNTISHLFFLFYRCIQISMPCETCRICHCFVYLHQTICSLLRILLIFQLQTCHLRTFQTCPICPALVECRICLMPITSISSISVLYRKSSKTILCYRSIAWIQTSRHPWWIHI